MENLTDHNDEDSLELASKTWNRVIDSASKTGFREGIKDGSMSVFQDGFDRGYKQAFRVTFLLGVYKGLANSMMKDVQLPLQVENILSKSKKGLCYLCEIESKGTTVAPDQSIDEIENCQKDHPDKILQILKDYFDPLFQEQNIDLSLLDLHK
ncbi:uncharacterized protein LOC100313522 isoform X1 [Nasonia vitripennis]|uniref:Essential protein Yae1 N-terminal domain-containing protein n=1 Tax=Nasonia vitripennis TaxID=7425 RepID=A0A7M7QCC2_NASVI|nr:uncharacterized protein LOC100313522 [Nasonia vitripennis]XP_008205428.1 uncharacterized protein LOC100313522 isoform X1 [Nasonia vitripennis]XP_031784318.1 uncharacterized protein LOC100313522 isoform X1 [Nasonia vitripennis]